MILSADDHDVAAALLDARFARRYLADGDSWFSLGGWTSNLLMALDDPDTLIVNCAYPGDTLGDMRRFGGDAFAELLAPTDGMPPWDAVLLSAGGNDLLCRCADYLARDPSDPIDDDALLAVLAEFETGLERLARLIDDGQPGVPAFVHTYDYPPVSRRWWWWQAGPWVSPAMRAAGVARGDWNGIATMLIDELAERIRIVARRWPALRVVDTRDTLLPGDWSNEIHPNSTGYAELARTWRKSLAAINQGATP